MFYYVDFHGNPRREDDLVDMVHEIRLGHVDVFINKYDYIEALDYGLYGMPRNPFLE